jgi:FkbM family methyltransferase
MASALKTSFVRLACAALRVYFRAGFPSAGKRQVWDTVVRPYLSWRYLPIVAKTDFGARIAGAFPDMIHVYTYFFGVWEPTLTAYIRSILREGDTVIDIGANVGVHSLLAASLVGRTGRVHAIEASPTIFGFLKANLARNGADNVTAHNVAVSDRRGRVSVYLHDDWNLGGTTIVPERAAELGAAVEGEGIEARPLPDIVPLEVLRAARLVKIDVEGAEWLVAQGMAPVLRELRRDVVILVELSAKGLAAFGVTFRTFLDLFAAEGFRAYRIENRYDPAFYIDPTPPLLEPVGELRDSADVVFVREADPDRSAVPANRPARL